MLGMGTNLFMMKFKSEATFEEIEHTEALLKQTIDYLKGIGKDAPEQSR